MCRHFLRVALALLLLAASASAAAPAGGTSAHDEASPGNGAVWACDIKGCSVCDTSTRVCAVWGMGLQLPQAHQPHTARKLRMLGDPGHEWAHAVHAQGRHGERA